MHAAVTVGTLTLNPPLVNGSGVVDVVNADEGWNLAPSQLAELGAFTTKTITSAPRTGHPQPWAETLGVGSLVNAAGLPNPGIMRVMEAWADLPELLGVPIIASIGGDAATLPDLAGQLSECSWVDAIELNLSCPNVDGGLIAGDPVQVAEVVARVRAQTTQPLLVKLTPACGAPTRVAQAAVAAGADALTCGNTMPIRATAPDGTPLLSAGFDGGLSGAALHPINLRLVASVAEAVNVPVIGLGGVDSIAAAMRMFDAGATIVGVGTGAVFDPTLIAQVAQWLAGSSHPSTST